jgi:hypothetical protein
MFITQEQGLSNPTVLWGWWSDFKLWGGSTNTDRNGMVSQMDCMHAQLQYSKTLPIKVSKNYQIQLHILVCKLTA